MVKYDDLLTVPFLPLGRTNKGMDCFGLVMELESRAGNKLNDIYINWDQRGKDCLQTITKGLNIEEINNAEENAIIQTDYKNALHVGFMLDKTTVIHMTYEGIKITSIFTFSKKKFYRVKNES